METPAKIKHKYKYLFIFLLLYVTDSGIINYNGTTGYYISMLLSFSLASISFINIILRNRSRQPVSTVFVLFILFSICSFSYLLGAGIGPIVKYSSVVLSAYFIAKSWDIYDFSNIYVNVCYIVAIASLGMYITVVAFPIIYFYLPVLRLNSINYRTIGLANMVLLNGQKIPRMYGPFWEPGVCQAYFNLALLFVISYGKGKKQVLQIIIFSLCIIATQSTTGYVAWSFIICLLIINKNKDHSNMLTILKIGLVSGALVLLLNLHKFSKTDIYGTVFSKMQNGFSNASFLSRYYSIIGNIEIALKHPLVGVGLNNSDDVLRSMYSIYNGIHQTNTLTNYLATFGLLCGLFFIFCWYNFVKRLSCGCIKTLLCIVAVACILSGENFLNSMVFTVFLMYGFVDLKFKRYRMY